MIVKHAEPVRRRARRRRIEDDYEARSGGRPVSRPYGGVVVLNRAVGAALGEQLAEQFVEVLYAPGFDAVAVETLGPQAERAAPRGHERRVVSPAPSST